MYKNEKKLLVGLVAIWIIILILSSTGCNPYKGITKHSPESNKDTLRLSERAAKTFTKPVAKTIVVYKRMADSSAYFKRLADSIKGLKVTFIDSLAIIYKDTCTEVIDSYKDGFELGYEVGKYDCKQRVRVDTIKVDSIIIDEMQLTATNIRLREQIAVAEKYRLKSERRLVVQNWLLIILLLSLVLNFFLIKRKLW